MYQIEWQNILCSCTIKTNIDKDIFKKLTRKERNFSMTASNGTIDVIYFSTSKFTSLSI